MSDFSDAISSTEDIIEDARNGRMFILVDHEDRENEGDLVIPAQMCTPSAINFMATHGRGLICLALPGSRIDALGLPLMSPKNSSRHETAFTLTIEAREGVTTGISAADRARTVSVAIDPTKGAADIATPGHIFPLRAREGGVLVRAGHTEAAVDVSRLAGLNPSGVICEIMNDDGTMARLPDLEVFAQQHKLKIGTIADLIQYRSRNESLIERMGQRTLQTPEGDFDTTVFRDRTGAVHLALTLGNWTPADEVLVRVHEPLSVMDWLDAGNSAHAWALPKALAAVREAGRGVVVLLNAGDEAERMLERALPPEPLAVVKTPVDLRTYGVGAQILRTLGVQRMRLMGNQRRMPSMVGYELEVVGFLTADGTELDPNP